MNVPAVLTDEQAILLSDLQVNVMLREATEGLTQATGALEHASRKRRMLEEQLEHARTAEAKQLEWVTSLADRVRLLRGQTQRRRAA